MPPYPLTNFKIQKYYQNEPKFNGVYSRNNSANLDDYESIGTHWIALYMNNDNVTHFDSFRVEYIPKEIKKFIDNKNTTACIYRIQENDSLMYGYLCIGFIDFVPEGKS